MSLTVEASNRRKMYQDDASRQKAATRYGDDYLRFLKDCSLELVIDSLSRSNLERVHELTQRTNQMNFSGTRYNRTMLEEILTTSHLDTYVMECQDRFGSYGIIGFSIVDRREPRMTDLMFSCRIQSKRVEHAFLQHILQHYIAETGCDFRADYRKTSRNAPSGLVFADLGMEEVATGDGVTALIFRKEGQVPHDDIFTVKSKWTVGNQSQPGVAASLNISNAASV